MTVNPYKEATSIPDQSFPINVFVVTDIHLHWHDHIEWIYVKEGKVRIQIDAAYEQLNKGDLAFVNSRQLHSAVHLAPDTELICIVFNEALVRGSGLDMTDLHYFMPYLQQPMKWPSIMRQSDFFMAEMNLTFTRLLEEFTRKETGYELLVKAELLRMFGLYFRYAQKDDALPIPRVQKAHDLTRLLHMMRERYCETISINDAARMVSLSPNHFCRIFKQVTGKTFIEYIHIIRIQEAERLLMETDIPITKISDLVGFSNMTYFGRIFKKIKNASPSDIRKRIHSS